MRSRFLKLNAFTLAEILLTLTIIGVVAAITIPTLVNNVQSDQFKVAWKKTYSDLSQATGLVINENGGNLKGAFSNTNNMRDQYIKYLNVIKSCDDGRSANNCWHANNAFKYLDNTIPTWGNEGGAILSNGTLVYFSFHSSTCTDSAIRRCGDIQVDINGFKGPNVIGKDMFAIQVLENSIKPYGFQGDGNETTCTTTGWGCSAQYLYQ